VRSRRAYSPSPFQVRTRRKSKSPHRLHLVATPPSNSTSILVAFYYKVATKDLGRA
jgi:hypothetical protein